MPTKTKRQPLTPKQIVSVCVYREEGFSNTYIANRLRMKIEKVRYIASMLIKAGVIQPYPRRWGFKDGTDYQKHLRK